MTMLKRSRFWAVLVGIWAVTLWFLSERQHVMTGPEIPHMDKVLHAGYFTLGSAAFYSMLRWSLRRFSPVALLWGTLLFAAGVGALDEFHQSFVPGRSGNDLGDWLADLTGGVIGLTVGRKLAGWLNRRSPAGGGR